GQADAVAVEGVRAAVAVVAVRAGAAAGADRGGAAGGAPGGPARGASGGAARGRPTGRASGGASGGAARGPATALDFDGEGAGLRAAEGVDHHVIGGSSAQAGAQGLGGTGARVVGAVHAGGQGRGERAALAQQVDGRVVAARRGDSEGVRARGRGGEAV